MPCPISILYRLWICTYTQSILLARSSLLQRWQWAPNLSCLAAVAPPSLSHPAQLPRFLLGPYRLWPNSCSDTWQPPLRWSSIAALYRGLSLNPAV